MRSVRCERPSGTSTMATESEEDTSTIFLLTFCTTVLLPWTLIKLTRASSDEAAAWRKLGFGAEAATAYHMSTCWMQQPHKANMATKPRGTIVVALSEGLPSHMVTPPTTAAPSRCADLAVPGRQRARRGAHVVDRGGILAVVVRPDPSPALGAVASLIPHQAVSGSG